LKNIDVRRRAVVLSASMKKITNDSIDELEINKYIDTFSEYEHMLEKIKGDGAASVSVEAEFSDKTYGQGISIKVRTFLTCDQSLECLETAYRFASQITQDQLEQNIPEVRRIYDENFTNKP
jgi:hypothetical protein